MCNVCFFFFKQKTAYEMRISDWSSDVCSSDLLPRARATDRGDEPVPVRASGRRLARLLARAKVRGGLSGQGVGAAARPDRPPCRGAGGDRGRSRAAAKSEEHTLNSSH